MEPGSLSRRPKRAALSSPPEDTMKGCHLGSALILDYEKQSLPFSSFPSCETLWEWLRSTKTVTRKKAVPRWGTREWGAGYYLGTRAVAGTRSPKGSHTRAFSAVLLTAERNWKHCSPESNKRWCGLIPRDVMQQVENAKQASTLPRPHFKSKANLSMT